LQVLLLQGFTGAKGAHSYAKSFVSADRHAVYVTPPCPGFRSAAIVLHRDVAYCMVPGSERVLAEAVPFSYNGRGTI